MALQPASWFGQSVTTTANPQRLAPQSPARVAWRAYALNSDAATGKIGYSSVAAQAYIPMPPDASYPVGSSADVPCENNELWFHGPIGSVVGFGEA
jgi:hypothetical protein